MTTQTHNTQKDVVKNLRKIRDEISNEIKDLTFEQERAYLDKLLAEKEKSPHRSDRQGHSSPSSPQNRA